MSLHKRNIFVQITIIFFFVSSMFLSVNIFDEVLPNYIQVRAQSANAGDSWNATITIQSSDGSGFTLKLGENTDAKDGVDSFDIPAPPSPPQLPHINARFLTSFDPPHSELIYEYKYFPNENNTWNFSVIWFAGPENSSTTNLTITWDSSAFENSEYSNIILLRNNTFVKNMLNSEEFTYSGKSNQPSFFSIVCSQGIINNSSNQNDEPASDTPFISMPALLSLIIIISYMIYKRRIIK